MSTIDIIVVFAVLNATIRQSIPLILGAMSGIASERSSIVNIGIEGMMLTGAFVGYTTNATLSGANFAEVSDNARLIISVLVGLLASGMMGLFHGILCIQYKVDHIISGTVVNLLAAGATGYFYDANSTTKGKIPNLISNPWPRGHFLRDIGVVLFDKDVITYITFVLVALMTFWLYSSVWGLRTRSIGENPRAADTLGVNVYRLQYTNLFISGVLAGLAGVYLTLADVGIFERGMTAGKGFIALAVMIFGKWHPMGALGGALLFGLLLSLQSQLQFLGLVVPQQLVALLPYVVTVVVLAGFVGQARPPAHVGRSYEVEGK